MIYHIHSILHWQCRLMILQVHILGSFCTVRACSERMKKFFLSDEAGWTKPFIANSEMRDLSR